MKKIRKIISLSLEGRGKDILMSVANLEIRVWVICKSGSNKERREESEQSFTQKNSQIP